MDWTLWSGLFSILEDLKCELPCTKKGQGEKKREFCPFYDQSVFLQVLVPPFQMAPTPLNLPPNKDSKRSNWAEWHCWYPFKHRRWFVFSALRPFHSVCWKKKERIFLIKRVLDSIYRNSQNKESTFFHTVTLDKIFFF